MHRSINSKDQGQRSRQFLCHNGHHWDAQISLESSSCYTLCGMCSTYSIMEMRAVEIIETEDCMMMLFTS